MIDVRKIKFAAIAASILAFNSACSPSGEIADQTVDLANQLVLDNAILQNQRALKSLEDARTAFAKSTEIEKSLIKRTSNYKIKDVSKRIGVYSSKPALFVNMSLTNPEDSSLHLIDVNLVVEHKGKIARVTFPRSHFRNPKSGQSGEQEFTLILGPGGFTDRKGFGAGPDFELSSNPNDFSITGYPLRVTLTKNWQKIEWLENRNDLNGFVNLSNILNSCNAVLKDNNAAILSLSKQGVKPSDGKKPPKFPDHC